jgi:hypothetical protein
MGNSVSTWRISSASNRSEWKAWLLNFIGVALALYIFWLIPRVAGNGTEVSRNVCQLLSIGLCSRLLCMAAPGCGGFAGCISSSRRLLTGLDEQKWLAHFAATRITARTRLDAPANLESRIHGRLTLRNQLGDGGARL